MMSARRVPQTKARSEYVLPKGPARTQVIELFPSRQSLSIPVKIKMQDFDLDDHSPLSVWQYRTFAPARSSEVTENDGKVLSITPIPLIAAIERFIEKE